MRAPNRYNRDPKSIEQAHAFIKKARKIAIKKRMIKQTQRILGNEIDTRAVSPTDEPPTEPYQPTDFQVVHQVKYSRNKINGHTLAKLAATPRLFKTISACLQKAKAELDTQENAKEVHKLFDNLDLTGVSSISSSLGIVSLGHRV
mmetsp:Transcript_15699/g.33437  ORF Transcript_15699/g.33437 Transcript_15699/m.33437 type:complete len:146 (+) Transcript_15699:874-1311(+)